MSAIYGFTRIGWGHPDYPKDVRTSVGFVKCDRCGKIIQASGLGIGSHRKKHWREDDREAAKG